MLGIVLKWYANVTKAPDIILALRQHEPIGHAPNGKVMVDLGDFTTQNGDIGDGGASAKA
jgi:hypothetical protein